MSWKSYLTLPNTRSHLKKVFWPKLFVGASLQILEILMYSCGLKLDPVAILNQNPFFEMASIHYLKTAP